MIRKFNSMDLKKSFKSIKIKKIILDKSIANNKKMVLVVGVAMVGISWKEFIRMI